MTDIVADQDSSHNIGAREFVDAIFGGLYDPSVETPALGQTWRRPDGEVVFPAWALSNCFPRHMHHVSIGLQRLRQPSPGFHNRKETWTGGMMLVLDDVGTKAVTPRVMPTWIMETSPGNQQWGYAFKEVLRDPLLFDAMLRSVGDAGLSDPGMRNITRWCRLPGSRPLGKAHSARLVLWQPARRFTSSLLLDGLGVPLGPRRRPPAPVRAAPGVEVCDRLLEWMESTGMVRAPSGDMVRIPCPWAHEHSTPDDNAYYRPATARNARRVFFCHHSHAPTTEDFIAAMVGAGAPQVEVVEPLPLSQELLRQWEEVREDVLTVLGMEGGVL